MNCLLLQIIMSLLIKKSFSKFTYFKYDIGEQPNHNYLYLRYINSTHIFIGNNITDGIYNLKENKFDLLVSLKSNWFQGSVCPNLFISKTTNQPKYIFSANINLKKTRIITINPQFQVFELNPFHNSIIVEQFLFNFLTVDDNNFIINTRTQRVSGFGGNTYLYSISVNNKKKINDNHIISQWQSGSILLEDNNNAPILLFSHSNGQQLRAYFYDLNLNNKKEINIQGLSKFNKEKGYFQSIELDDHIIITCHIKEDSKSDVICFSGKYNSNQFNVISNWKTILTDCPKGQYYSIYKYNNVRTILGCYKNGELEIKLLNANLNYISTSISGNKFKYADFTSSGNQQVIIAIARENNNNLIEYIGLYFSCPSEITIKNKEFKFINYTYNIQILELPSYGKLYETIFLDDGLSYTLGTEVIVGGSYNLNNLIYIAENSNLYDFFQYKNNEGISFDNNILIKEQCDMKFLICHEYCSSCSKLGNSTNENCITCKEGYFMNPYIFGNCIPNCVDKAWYYDNEFKFHCLKSSNECQNDNMLFIENNRQCVNSCNDTTRCEFCKTHSLYEYDGKCLLSCVDGTIRNDGKCIESEENDEDEIIEDFEEEESDENNNNEENNNPNIDDTNNNNNDNNDNNNNDNNDNNNNDNNNNNLDDIDDNERDDCCITEKKDDFLLEALSNPTVIGNQFLIQSTLNNNAFEKYDSQLFDLCFNGINELRETAPVFGSVVNGYCKKDVYPTDISLNDRKEANISYINLGDCEKKLREHYKIPNSEKIYIDQYKCIGDNMNYSVYNSRKEKLDLSICEGIDIKISIPIDPSNPKIQLLLALEMQEQGVDIYNENETVFNDKCTSLSLEGKDLSLEARQKDVYTNISDFCNDGCKAFVNKTSFEIECTCPPVVKEEKKEKEKENINTVLEDNEYVSMVSNIFSSTNIHLFGCFKILKILKDFKSTISNIGFDICFICIILEFIFGFFFLKKKLTFIFSQIFRSNEIASPIKKKMSNDQMVSVSSKKNLDSFSPKKSDIYIYREKKSNYQKYLNEFDNDNGSSTKRIVKLDRRGSKSKLYIERALEEEKKAKEEFSNSELNELNNFADVQDLDKRGFFTYLLSIFIEKQIFLSTIFKNSLFYPFSFRLFMFLFTGLCFLFLNALFFTEEYLNERYKADKLDFVYIIKNEMTKSLYASILVLIIGKILDIITYTNINYLKIIKNIDDTKFPIRLKNFIFEIKRKFWIIIITIIILSFFIWYFLFIFCYLYKNNQVSWLQSTLISMIINFIFPIIICIIIGIIRFISLKLNSAIIFDISHLIYAII